MEWAHKWGKDLASGQYYQQLLPRGFVPEDQQEPLIDGLEFYLDAFRELSTSRPVGMSLCPIPFTAIVEYSRIYETGDFDEFIYLMRQMDETFLKLNSQVATRRKDAAGNADTKNINKR